MKQFFLKIFKKRFIKRDILGVAEEFLGKNLCSNPTYGSAETVNALFEMATGRPISTIHSDWMMRYIMKNDSKRFLQINYPEAGAIIVSPSDEVKNGNIGIIGKDMLIYMNNYSDGKLMKNISVSQWLENYSKDFTVEYFKIL